MTDSSDEVEVQSEVSDMSVEGDDEDLAQMPEKYLIFTTGSKTYTPHQIGNYEFNFVFEHFKTVIYIRCIKNMKTHPFL